MTSIQYADLTSFAIYRFSYFVCVDSVNNTKTYFEDIRSYTLPNRLVLPGWIVVFALFLFRWITTGRADLPILAAALVAFVGFAGFAFAGVLGMGMQN